MTLAPHPPAIAAPDVPTVLEALRRRGLRISTARRLVIEALFAARGPVPATRIAEGPGGAGPPLDLASVYANLETLEGIGLVAHVHVGHGPGLYVLRDRIATDYVGCERCGALRAVEPSALRAVRDAVREATGFEARFDHFPLIGLCPECADA